MGGEHGVSPLRWDVEDLLALLSLCRANNTLDIIGASKRRAIKEVTQSAEVASRWLWIRRGEPLVG